MTRPSHSFWVSFAAVTLLGCGEAATDLDGEPAGPLRETTPLVQTSQQAAAAPAIATASFSIDGQQLSMPIVLRLQADPDGQITLTGGSMQGNRMLSLRATLPNSNAKAAGSRIAFHGGVGQNTSLMIVEGSLPNVKLLTSIDGHVNIARMSEKAAQLDFDVGMSARPDGSTGRVSAQGSVSGPIQVVCLKYADATTGGGIDNVMGGEGHVIVSDETRSSPQCSAMLKQLDAN